MDNLGEMYEKIFEYVIQNPDCKLQDILLNYEGNICLNLLEVISLMVQEDVLHSYVSRTEENGGEVMICLHPYIHFVWLGTMLSVA